MRIIPWSMGCLYVILGLMGIVIWVRTGDFDQFIQSVIELGNGLVIIGLLKGVYD